jgi:hypothetical protein
VLDRTESKITEARRTETWPRRPGPRYLSAAIRLFYIARDANGFWVAREANGEMGGQFLCRRSAYRFARDASRPNGSATMALKGRHDLDVPNQGGRLASLIARLIEWLRLRRAFH